MTTQQILIHGGPKGGFTFVGPFDDEDAAIAHAEESNIQDNWWVAPLHPGARMEAPGG